ncbi:MAG: CDP-glycerol glycerophosphotransferase family protein [Coriobacteriia bacterium]|nr:CDP-glycerol glycerophosphotransferase family protein [Coriobacteriia bacterium]
MTRLELLLSTLFLRAWWLVFRALPIDPRKVVFASARAESLQGNLRYIDEAIGRHRPDLRRVHLLERYGYRLADKVRYLLHLVRGTYHLATARFFILDNAYLPVHVLPHRPDTVVIQVWHAMDALKRFGLDTAGLERPVERRFLHKRYDYVVVGSDAAVAPYASALRTDPAHVVALGTARTDFFFDEEQVTAARRRVLERHPEIRGKRVVLYAPTFRGAGHDKHSARLLDLGRLAGLLADGDVLMYKRHPVLGPSARTPVPGVVYADPGLDLNELFCVTDILVTDYTSAIFEYALLRKPLILLIPDLEEYEREPGLYLDYRTEMIGERATTTEEVAQLIERGVFDMGDYDGFIATHGQYADGRASERFVEFLGTL